jgi:putative inorganic carbon (HCO3(-)) transporter
MLRDLALSLCFLGCLALSLRYAYAGVLTWTWLAIMQPNHEIYGVITTSLRLNFLVAIVAIFAWYTAKDRKMPPSEATLVMLSVFFVWMTFTSAVGVSPYSWYLWDRVWRIIALAVLIGASATSKVRIHALIWVIVLSLLYYGVKGGLLTLTSGGAMKGGGPGGTAIGDNNQLALALLMILPLAFYLRRHSSNHFVRMGLTVSAGFTFLAVLGSYSRGAFLALGALCVLGWLRSRNKFVFPILLFFVAYPALNFMPQSFYNRMNTMNSLDNDGSFQGRVMAWKAAYYYARDHFPIGAGFSGVEQPNIFNYYFPGEATHSAHSIYFQILGDHGFIGLAMFVVILFLAFLNAQKIRKLTRKSPDLAWAGDLATMIQLSLLVYCIGGAALSLAYYDVPIMWYLLLPVLLQVVQKAEARQTQATPIGSRNFAPRQPAMNFSNSVTPFENPTQVL